MSSELNTPENWEREQIKLFLELAKKLSLMNPFIAEFIGTCILMVLGAGVVANVSLKNTAGEKDPGPPFWRCTRRNCF